MGGPFSLRCLSPLGSPAVGTGQAQPMRVGMLHCSLDGFAAQKTVLIFSSALGTMPTQPALLRILRSILDILATQNASAESNPRWHFSASRRACRPTAILSIQLTGSHTRPASREACRRAAVKPRPTCFPFSTPAPYRRGVGCRALALQNASAESNPRWHFLRAGGPVTRRRSFLFN